MEQLFIVEDDRSDERTRRALRSVRKSQEFSERVFVAEGDARSIAALGQSPGVRTPSQLTADAADALSPAERLSIDAWQSRAEPGAKVRPGDGLSWGHKDFRAPR
ncbi:hypothetical protein MPAR168_04185 [Methylorubrum populi]|uniref:Uncharacterized protein n=1 Tax=Methylobacterium radiotolerans TaxID=31998 RepID=A0ABU7TAK3_9HYPH